MNGSATDSGLIASQHMSGEPVRTCEPALLAADSPVPEQGSDGAAEDRTIVLGED
ncbi:hypothetical protein [Streptomyces sp. NBC_00467]|uniref:hypothetical protein n=1 Tax=Streptomyces sp. NBC_00467 TaxID=2975752 RepID=UPI002E177836